MNMLLYVIFVLNLIHKYVFAEFCFKRMHSLSEADLIMIKLRDTMLELFNHYKTMRQPSNFEHVNESSQISQPIQHTSESN